MHLNKDLYTVEEKFTGMSTTLNEGLDLSVSNFYHCQSDNEDEYFEEVDEDENDAEVSIFHKPLYECYTNKLPQRFTTGTCTSCVPMPSVDKQ
jgi:hypothetical protein